MGQSANSVLSSRQLLVIDEICERFETALRGGDAPRIEEYLDEAGDDFESEQIFAHLLAVEVDFRLARGDSVHPHEYRSRFPARSAAIAQILPHECRADGPAEIGPYRIISKLGSGGMGSVYKAFQPRLNRFVAIKMLPKGLLEDQVARQRFDRELKAAGRVLHPNIVTAFDAGQAGNIDYLVMELVEGFDLARLAGRVTPFPVADACELVRQASLGLAEVHKLGLVHRDIKPANLMLGPHGNLKILDLGLALLQQPMSGEKGVDLTNTNQMMGTFDYMAPEQCVDSHAVDERADVYALGATLFRLLSGSVPFGHRRTLTQVGRLSAKLLETPPSLRELRSDVPDALAAIVERMLAREPERRVASATEVAKLLEPFGRTAKLERLFERAVESAETAATISTTTQGLTLPEPTLQDAESARQTATGLRPRLDLSGRRFWFLLLLTGTAAAILSGVFFLQTPHGTVRVEINDPRITAQISGEKVVLRQADGAKSITLSPGERQLHVERDGFSFWTDQIEIRNRQQVSLRVDFLEGVITVRNREEVIGREKVPPVERKPESVPAVAPQAATPDSSEPQIKPSQLPGPEATDEEISKYLVTLGAQTVLTPIDASRPGDVKLTRLRWAHAPDNPSFEALQPCARLRHLEELGYHGGNEGLRLFLGCTGLKSFELGPSQLDAEGAKILARFPKIERVQIPCGDCKAFLAELKKIPTITHIQIYRCSIRDDDIEPLVDMPQLRELWVTTPSGGPLTSGVMRHLVKMKQLKRLALEWIGGPTEAETQQLRAALPDCSVN